MTERRRGLSGASLICRCVIRRIEVDGPTGPQTLAVLVRVPVASGLIVAVNRCMMTVPPAGKLTNWLMLADAIRIAACCGAGPLP